MLYPAFKEIDECVICLEPLASLYSPGRSKEDHITNSDLQLVSVTPCFHIFHKKCLSQWFQNSKCCPMCRKENTPLELKELYPWVKLGHHYE